MMLTLRKATSSVGIQTQKDKRGVTSAAGGPHLKGDRRGM